MTIVPRQIPDSLTAYTGEQEALILKAMSRLETITNLAETHVWQSVASTFSPEWKTTHDHLRSCEEDVEQLSAPEHQALGLIGAALQGDSINQTLTRHSIALAQFTIIDENLRQMPHLKNIHECLMLHYQVDRAALKIPEHEIHNAALKMTTASLVLSFKKHAHRALKNAAQKIAISAGSALSSKET